MPEFVHLVAAAFYLCWIAACHFILSDLTRDGVRILRDIQEPEDSIAEYLEEIGRWHWLKCALWPITFVYLVVMFFVMLAAALQDNDDGGLT
jgi:hypothetical protein